MIIFNDIKNYKNMKCNNCGVDIRNKSDRFCSNSCKMINYRKFVREYRQMYKKLYNKYFK